MRSFRLLFLALFVFGSTVTLSATEVITDPPGARIILLDADGREPRDGIEYTSPADIRFRRSRDPYEIEISLPGYETVRRTVEGDRREVVEVTLVPLVAQKQFSFLGAEPGSILTFADGRGREAVEIPGVLSLRFERVSSSANWDPRVARLEKPGYQPEEITVFYGDSSPYQLPALSRTADEKQFTIEAVTEEGESLQAMVEIGGNTVGTTPLNVTLPFQRADRDSPWSEHTVRVSIEDVFIPVEASLGYESQAELEVVLEPVTEVPVIPYFPITRQSPRGPSPGWDVEPRLAMLDSRDLMSPAQDTRPITRMTRENPTLQAINSFCLTADGQNVVYSITKQREDGAYYANLFIKAATDRTMAFSQLTRGQRAIDTNPAMAGEEASQLVVFQSNRSDPAGWDISSFRLRDNRLVGGITQLTREPRLNYGPSLASEQLPIYFISQHLFPQSEPLISYVRADGSGTTNLMETGQHLHVTQRDKIYFVREAPDTGKKRIYSITPEGLRFSTVITDFSFQGTDTFSPRLSPDGNSLLFVSDYAEDQEGRKNNNLFLLDLQTERIQQVTDNGSDDVHPRWSPTEPGVIFFLSNRGGAYNIWRMRLPPTG